MGVSCSRAPRPDVTGPGRPVHVLRRRFASTHPAHGGCRRGRRAHHADRRGRQPLLGVPRSCLGARLRPDAGAARYPRAVHVLRGAGAALRGSGHRFAGDRLLRAHRGPGRPRWRLRIPVPRGPDELGRPVGRHRGRGRGAARRWPEGHPGVRGGLLLRRAARVRERDPRAGAGWGDRVLRTADRSSTGHPRARRGGEHDGLAGAGPVRRGGSRHPCRDGGDVRGGALVGGRAT